VNPLGWPAADVDLVSAEDVPDATAGTFSAVGVEQQLELARRYIKDHDDARGKRAVYDKTFGWLQRTTRELEQYARAVRWVMTVDEGR